MGRFAGEILGVRALPIAPAKNLSRDYKRGQEGMSFTFLTFDAAAEPASAATADNTGCLGKLKAKPTTRLMKIIPIWLVFLLIIILHDNLTDSG